MIVWDMHFGWCYVDTSKMRLKVLKEEEDE